MKHHITNIEDMIGRTVPCTAMVEITRLANYYGIDNFSIIIEKAEAIEVTSPVDFTVREMKVAGDPFSLNLKYDMRIYEKRTRRRAVATSILYFRGRDKKYYKILITNSLEMVVGSNHLDSMMFSALYLYARELFMNVPWIKYTDDPIDLPLNYAEIDNTSKEHYDGYIEYRNSHDLRMDIDTSKKEESNK